MLEDLQCVCDAEACDRTLGEEQLMLVMETDAGVRQAYECACGAVTVAVSR